MLLTCVEVELVAVGGFVVELSVRKRDVRTGWVGVLLAKAKAPEEVEGVRQVLRSIRTLLGLTSVAITISATVEPKRHSQERSVERLWIAQHARKRHCGESRRRQTCR